MRLPLLIAAILPGVAPLMAFQTGGPPPSPVPAAVAPATDTGPPRDAKRPKEGDSVVAGLIYNGQKGNLNVRIPRFDNEIDVDGTLSAPVWQQAALLNGFSEYFPVDGRAGVGFDGSVRLVQRDSRSTSGSARSRRTARCTRRSRTAT